MAAGLMGYLDWGLLFSAVISLLGLFCSSL